MSAESLEIAKTFYQTGKIAFENGRYREAVENLEKASALLARNSPFGGEVEISLVTAYEAAGRTDDAIALCERLKRHPYIEISKQARQMVYILKAPKLKRPSEWMTQIPDLNKLPDNELKISIAAKPTKSSVQQKPKSIEPEFVDLSQVNTRDNRFIWVALIAIGLTISYLVWLNFSGTPG
ncbi:MAG: tetratricopeptide repeat protein [Nostoc sp. DedVER02]|uniref:tetratricopeptide repeat protein n=1 Tax=unclassified Nostoc TaxID=2593658 RepID=UPI002AD47D22|nr:MULTISPECIES: tetratricopeptide repeat protein [unclassified Nostoc]MDZ7985759.1 tetratricopeptide repeat protein [Nostoc sp. DedVER02]MDZ8111416.1 tetratricopeptide repeat protein [Nostoc sp. DedVER01b]